LDVCCRRKIAVKGMVELMEMKVVVVVVVERGSALFYGVRLDAKKGKEFSHALFAFTSSLLPESVCVVVCWGPLSQGGNH
jgi:hypothetical protein